MCERVFPQGILKKLPEENGYCEIECAECPTGNLRRNKVVECVMIKS